MQSEITERAKTAWNSIADEFNQWDALGLDEQETYVALTAALVDLPSVESEPVAWLDDGTLRSGSVSTARRVVTNEQKRDMPAAIASSFTIPLYLHPPISREGEDSAEVERLREAARRIVPYLQWTISKESPGFHPTMRSAVGAFMSAFGWSTEEAWREDMRSALAATRSGSTRTTSDDSKGHHGG